MIRNEFREYGSVLALSLNSSLAPSKLRSTLPLGPTVFFSAVSSVGQPPYFGVIRRRQGLQCIQFICALLDSS